MAENNVNRKLAAILSADVVGYSKLMADDEAATVKTLKQYRVVIGEVVESHKGRVVNAPGDNILAEFASAVEAVQAAVEIQKSIDGKNVDLSEQRRMRFRIGINLGDVIEEDDGTIYGDGVNIAARMEALADVGGICISSKVLEEVESKLDLGFEFAGEQTVKNIAKPVRVYRVHGEPGKKPARPTVRKSKKLPLAIATIVLVIVSIGLSYQQFNQGQSRNQTGATTDTDPALSLPAGPSIAVLPFDNMSGDPDQEYFSDGITEDIITDLSKLSDLKVIARNSTFAYKGKPVDVRKVGSELGVRYVLEGSVRRAGQQLRITAQLIDATTGDHLWAERYDRSLHDVFEVQDEITRHVVEEMEVKLLRGEQARVWRRSTNDAQAYDLLLRGRNIIWTYRKEDFVVAKELLSQATELDPEFAAAFVHLGWFHHTEAILGWSNSRQASFELALDLGRRAIELDGSLGDAYSLLSLTKMQLRDIDAAIEYGEQAVALTPNNADVRAWFAIALAWAVDPRAIEMAKSAMRLNPNPPAIYWNVLGTAHVLAGNLEDGIRANDQCIAQIPNFIWCHVWQAVAYMETGEEALAQIEVAEIRRIDPNASSDFYTGAIKDPVKRARFYNLLIKAGLPN
jgi:adenylate cyclase